MWERFPPLFVDGGPVPPLGTTVWIDRSMDGLTLVGQQEWQVIGHLVPLDDGNPRVLIKDAADRWRILTIGQEEVEC